ncbi:Alpha-1,2 mannosyltransferase KTR1 [Colletotrichum chlorophyti]|uniref:Alpha-1,2 mannosyltransferase KTR1 n=1 Tax=Colletotrichum chlorophyti TaxID=708187 RepID=A0A1Q8S4D9_9PEZI|nr:Alpha-1,2 mannosyltransferase KTR1 [Colletotrichum chlorophyti]
MAGRHVRSFLPQRKFFILLVSLFLLLVPSSWAGSTHRIDPPLRAVFIVLVEEHQLNQMVDSIQQLERHFNNKYRYDWAFFSNKELSDDFKDATSNATTATITYDLIPEQHWVKSNPVERGPFVDVDKELLESISYRKRWSAGLFAREKRLQAYDWFWMVEPGAQFLCDITVDVFRLMKDRGIFYGTNEVSPENIFESELLWQSTKRFIEEHPEIVQPQADIIWILSNDGKLSTPTITKNYYDDDDNEDGEPKLLSNEVNDSACGARRQKQECALSPSVPQNADIQQCEPEPVADSFTTRLAAKYNHCNLNTPIEIGYLEHFRGPEHKFYFEHLDKAGNFVYGTASNIPIHSLSASMFLPRDRVWLLNDMPCEMRGRHSCPPAPRETAHVEASEGFVADVPDRSWSGLCDNEVVESIHKRWACISVDLARQDAICTRHLGHTALDERNFKLLEPQRYPSYVDEEWFNVLDGKKGPKSDF